ncbi:MAG: hypothetical protein OWS74_09160 [Firmicutes bacterium]|nr:hypothetical protein [Bacillota bacterium]
MNGLTLFGAIVVTLMMIFYALEDRSLWYTLAFAATCLGSSAYGWLAGTWPFGVVEGIWALVALRKWWHLLHSLHAKRRFDPS